MRLNQFLEVNHGKGLGKHISLWAVAVHLEPRQVVSVASLGKLKPKLVICDHAQQVLR